MKIKKEIYDEIIQHCLVSLPYEACGILAGKENFVSIAYKIKNTEDSSFSYFMEPTEQLRAIKDMKKKELEMIGIFHSHPFGTAYPSQKDIELSFYDVYNVIVAFEPQFEVRCFRIKDGKINEEKLVIEE